jgi:hypothetical protein
VLLKDEKSVSLIIKYNRLSMSDSLFVRTKMAEQNLIRAGIEVFCPVKVNKALHLALLARL